MGWLSRAIKVLEIRRPCESARVETSTRVLLPPIRLRASPVRRAVLRLSRASLGPDARTESPASACSMTPESGLGGARGDCRRCASVPVEQASMLRRFRRGRRQLERAHLRQRRLRHPPRRSRTSQEAGQSPLRQASVPRRPRIQWRHPSRGPAHPAFPDDRSNALSWNCLRPSGRRMQYDPALVA